MLNPLERDRSMQRGLLNKQFGIQSVISNPGKRVIIYDHLLIPLDKSCYIERLVF